jgi:uroporphyrinogen decarboxylase
MTKVERVRAALRGVPVDHPPITVWYHFGLQHAPAETMAAAHLEFLDAYDLDWLKVMNDYSYPMPKGLEVIATAGDLRRIEPLDPGTPPMGEQLRVIEILGKALAGRCLFVDTLFNAWNTLRRSLAKEAMPRFMREHPAEVLQALTAVNDTLIAFATASLARGAAGIFLAVPASEEYVTREEYERFMRPFDLALLAAIRHAGEGHILHAHGRRIYLDRMLDHPVSALSWADRDSGPSLGEVRKRTALPLMGGLSQSQFAYVSATTVRQQVRDAIGTAGKDSLLIAPGCALPSYAFPEQIRAVVAEARA